MKKILILVFLSLFLITCDKNSDDQNPTQETPEEIIIKENVVTFTEDTTQLLSDDNQILNGEFVFQFNGNAPEIELGDVIVIEHEKGYLRRVANVIIEGNTITLETIQATMEDVFDNAQFSFSSNISPESRSSGLVSESVHYNYLAEGVSVSDVGLVFDFSNTNIYQDGPLSFKITDGTATFNPNFTFDFDFEDGNLEYFQFRADDASLTIDCGLQLATSGTVNLLNGEKTLVDYDRYVTFFAGIVPVVIVINTKLVAELNVNATAEISFSSGFINQSIVDVGATYSNGTWDGIFNTSNSFDPKPLDASNTISINQGLVITPKISTQIYSILGPYVSPEMTENFNIAVNPNSGDWDAQLKTGLHPKIGVEAEIFGDNLLDFYLDITPLEEIVYSAPKTIEIVSGNEQTGQQGQELDEPLKVKVTDGLEFALSDVPVYFTVNASDGSVTEEVVQTDDDGFAQVNWTLGTINTSQGLVVKVKKANGDYIESVAEFTAEAEVASLELAGDLNFGDVATNDSAQLTLTINNITMESVNVSSLDLPNGFTANWNSGSIAGESSQEVIISFSPTQIQAYNGSIVVNNDLSEENNSIEVSGNGISPMTLTGNLNFGNVMVNTTSNRTFTIINNSSQVLNISSIDLPNAFTSNWNGGAIVGEGSQDVIITFSPTQIQDYSGTAIVNNDAGATNNTLSISANGTENTESDYDQLIIGTWLLTGATENGINNFDPNACDNIAIFNGTTFTSTEYYDAVPDSNDCSLEDTVVSTYEIVDGIYLYDTYQGDTDVSEILDLNETTMVLKSIDGNYTYIETLTRQ